MAEPTKEYTRATDQDSGRNVRSGIRTGGWVIRSTFLGFSAKSTGARDAAGVAD